MTKIFIFIYYILCKNWFERLNLKKSSFTPQEILQLPINYSLYSSVRNQTAAPSKWYIHFWQVKIELFFLVRVPPLKFTYWYSRVELGGCGLVIGIRVGIQSVCCLDRTKSVGVEVVHDNCFALNLDGVIAGETESWHTATNLCLPQESSIIWNKWVENSIFGYDVHLLINSNNTLMKH